MWAEPSSGCATMSYLPSLYCLRSSEGKAMRGPLDLFLGGLEHARQVDLVELDGGLVGGLDRGLLGIVSCRRLRRRVAGGGCAHGLSGLITAILRSSSLSVRASWSRSSLETMTCASGLSLCTW